MNNHILPFLETGVSDRFTSSKQSNVTEDKGFSKTFQDIEQKVSYADKKESTSSAREPSANREPLNNKKSSANRESASTDKSTVDKNAQAAKETNGVSGKVEEPTKSEPSVNDNISNTDTDNSTLHKADNSTSHDTEAQSNVVTGTVAATTGTETIDTLKLQSLLDTILDKLQAIKQDGGTEALESAIDPEALQELVNELFVDGNELPLAPVIASIKEALSSSSGVTLGAAANLLSDLQKISPLKPLAEALTTKLSSQVQLSSTAIANDSTIAESDLLHSQVLSQSGKLSLSGDALAQVDLQKLSMDQVINAISKEENGAAVSRLTNEYAGQPLQNTQSVQPGAKAQLLVSTPFQQAQWGKDVAERVMWMSSQGVKEAEIHLDPPELGPLQVRVSVVNEQAHVSFVVQHSTVREALDQNAMRLREMFDGEGINLADVDVSDQSQEQGDSNSEPGESASSLGVLNEDVQQGEISLSSNRDGYSLLNLYA